MKKPHQFFVILTCSILTFLPRVFTAHNVDGQNQTALPNFNRPDTGAKDSIRYTPGEVRVIVDPATEELIDLYDEADSKNSKLSGYRVEIFSGSGANSKQRAREMQKKFREDFENVPAYLRWEYPNFEVRVGNFRTKLEAEACLNKIQEKYPFAYIKRDKIDLPKLEGK